MSLTYLEDILRQVTEFEDHAEIPRGKTFVFFGEDPFAHPRYLESVRLLYNYEYRRWIKNIATNGYGIAKDPKYKSSLKGFMKLGLDTLRLTLFGMEHTHDWFARRKGAFEQILSASIRAGELGIKVKWHIMLHLRNVSEIDRIIELSTNYVKDQISYIGVPEYSGRAQLNDDLRPTLKDIKKLSADARSILRDDLKTESEWVDISTSEGFPKNKLMKTIPAISVQRDGIVKDISAPYFGYTTLELGNLKENTLWDILKDFSPSTSESAKAWHNVKDEELGREYGDKDCLKLYDPLSIRLKWFIKFLEATNCYKGA